MVEIAKNFFRIFYLVFSFASVWTNRIYYFLLRNPIRRNLKQSDFEEGFFGSKQDREIAAANADLEKSATTAAAALDSRSRTDSAVTDTPRETADKKAVETELGAGNSKLVTTLPPVKTKVCLGKIGITGRSVADPWIRTSVKRIRHRIMVFSSVTFKTATENYGVFFCLLRYFLKLQDKKSQRSH